MGYYKNFKSECIPCELENCELCFGPDQDCNYCAEGYYVQENGTCGKESCNGEENCDQCINDVCLRCSYRFYSKDGICSACSDQIENCVNCMTKEKKCVECAENYIPAEDGQSCVPMSIPEELQYEKRTDGEDIPENEEDEDEGDKDESGDPEQFEPKDSWGFDVLKDTAEYYLEAEVQYHVGHTIYVTYMAQFANDHDRVVKFLHKKFLAGYNYLGWAFNRLIMDDPEEDKFFLNLIPWELMIYVDSKPISMVLKLLDDNERSTDPSYYYQKSRSFKQYMASVYETTGVVADMHMYFVKPTFHGAVVGVALKKVWYGLAMGMDKAGGVVGHELGHTMCMPDAYVQEGNGGTLTPEQKYGTPGSYYSPWRTRKIRGCILDQDAFTKTVCNTYKLSDGRLIGRITMNQDFYHSAKDTRDGLCKQFGGESCYFEGKKKSCRDMACTCVAKKW